MQSQILFLEKHKISLLRLKKVRFNEKFTLKINGFN